MHKKNGIQLVCFDLGGVLVRLATDGWVGACQRAGVKLPHHDPVAWEAHGKVLRDFEVGAFDEESYIRQLPVCLPDVKVEHVLAVFDAWLIEMYPGAAELIDELKSRGIRTACLSNTNARHWRAMTGDPQFEPVTRLDHLLASHELKLAKPHREIYLRAQRELGIDVDKILFFDDRPENIEGARSVGWCAELVTRVDDAVGQMRELLRTHGVL